MAKGDENALDAFMDFYSSHLYRIAFGVTGNKETAEEIVSDVFFNVWEQRRKLLEIENLPGYLRNTTYRMSLTRYRHEDTRDFSCLSIDDIEEFHHSPVVSSRRGICVEGRSRIDKPRNRGAPSQMQTCVHNGKT